MKLVLPIIILLIIDIVVSYIMYSELGFTNLLYLLLIGTVIGVVFLLLRKSANQKAKEEIDSMGGNLFQYMFEVLRDGTEFNAERIHPFIFTLFYAVAKFLIIFPGILTDIVGVILISPLIGSFLVHIQAQSMKGS